MVDVDGSYMFLKHQRVAESGVNVAPLGIPPPPISGWDSVTEENFRSLSGDIPRVTSGEYIMSMRCMHVLAHESSLQVWCTTISRDHFVSPKSKEHSEH